MENGFWAHPAVSVISVRVKEAEELLEYETMNSGKWRVRGVRI